MKKEFVLLGGHLDHDINILEELQFCHRDVLKMKFKR